MSNLPKMTASQKLSRRDVLACGARALAAGCCGGALLSAGCNVAEYVAEQLEEAAGAEIFPGGAPDDELWALWQRRGWAEEARHCLELGENIQCKLCPNECLLEPGDRSRCRNRVHKDGKLYTMAYANPCSTAVDPIEKKPLYHFLPDTLSYSIATTGCGFRCLNCQNWDISQRKPEELKDPRGDRLQPGKSDLYRFLPGKLSPEESYRLTMMPENVAALAKVCDCESIAYTYSEPTVWFEYMIDTAQAVRAEGLKNVWVTCGYIQQEPLEELCQWIDAATST